MSLSPSPSPRKRANTIHSPAREWNVRTTRAAAERPLSALRSPLKGGTLTPSHAALPQSPMPKFDLSTTLPKASSPTRTHTRDTTKKEVKDVDVPVFDFSIRGTNVQKPAALRRKPLMATPGQASSHISPMAKITAVAREVPDRPQIVRGPIIPESAVGLRVKQSYQAPLPAPLMSEPSSRKLNRLKPAPQSVPLPESPMGAFSLHPVNRVKQSPDAGPLLGSSNTVVAPRVPTKPSMRASDMRSSSESSQRSLAILANLSPGTKKHVVPQLLDKPPSQIASTNIQPKRRDKQAAQPVKSHLDGSGLGLSPTKAAKAPTVHNGPAKIRDAVNSGSAQPAVESPRLERQTVNGDTFLVSSKPLRLQTKLQVSPRSARAGPSSPKHVSSKGKGRESQPIEFGVVKGGQMQAPPPKNRFISESTSTAGADDERGNISSRRPGIDHKISESEAHVLAVDPDIDTRKPWSRRLNTVSDSIVPNTSQHHESIGYQSKQYIDHTLSQKSLLGVDDGYQRELKTTPLMKTLPIKRKVSSDDLLYQEMVKKACEQKTVSVEEAAYQAVIKKAYIDEKPKVRGRLSRPRTRHRHGSSGQTQIDADGRGSSSEFSVDFLKSDASQKIILETFTRLNTFGSRPQEQPTGPTPFDPVRNAPLPGEQTVAEGSNFSRRKDVSPSKRVLALELELPVMPAHGPGLDLSSDHPLSPLRMKSFSLSALPSPSATKSGHPFEHFDEVNLADDYDLEADVAYRGTSVEELHERVAELGSMLSDSKNFQNYEVDDKFVHSAAELALMVDAVEKHSRLDAVDKQLLPEGYVAANMEMPHKSALNLRHRSSLSAHKSVRWDPSIDEDDSEVLQQKVVNDISRADVKDKKSDAEAKLENLFVPPGSPLTAEETELLNRVVKTIRARGGVNTATFAALLSAVPKIEDKNKQGGPRVKNLDRIAGIACVGPSPKLNPLSPAFMPKNLKENDSWAPEPSALEGQRMHLRVSADEFFDRKKPVAQEHCVLSDPAILSVRSPPRRDIGQNLFCDPAILSASPSKTTHRGSAVPNQHHSTKENFQAMSLDHATDLDEECYYPVLFSSDPAETNQRGFDGPNPYHTMTKEFKAMLLAHANDPVQDRSQYPPISTVAPYSPRLMSRALAEQRIAPAPNLVLAFVPGPAPTQSIRKRVIWDNPDEPGGREAIITSKKYAEECLEKFCQKYPLTGQKAKVLPKKRLEDLPKKYEEEMPLLVGAAGMLKPKPLATDAADIQQKLEVLLLRKKEAKVQKLRDGSGSGQNCSEWGAPAITDSIKGAI